MRRLVWLMSVFLFAPGAPAEQRIWSWKDKSGVVHYTDDPEKLPEPQRSEALHELEKDPPPKKAPEPAPASEPAAAEPTAAEDPSPDSSGGALEKARQRRELKAELERLHGSYLDLQEACRELEEKLVVARRDGQAIYGRPSGGAPAAELEVELKNCRQELDRARQDLLRQISAARGAGVSVSGFEP